MLGERLPYYDHHKVGHDTHVKHPVILHDVLRLIARSFQAEQRSYWRVSFLNVFCQSFPEVKNMTWFSGGLLKGHHCRGWLTSSDLTSCVTNSPFASQKLTWKSFPSVGSVAPHRPPHAIGCKGVHPSSAQICLCANDSKIPDHHSNSHHSISLLSLLDGESLLR